MSFGGMQYEYLNRQEKMAYELFLQTYSRRGDTVKARSIRGVDPKRILRATLGDHPQFVYFDKTSIATVSGSKGVEAYRLEGVRSGAALTAMEGELEQAVSRALEAVDEANPMNDFDRMMALYEYLQDHVVYDRQELENRRRGARPNAVSHNAYGALVRGKAVCDGISAAFCLLAQRLGYECTTVSGDAAFRTEKRSSHAWNVIRVKDKYYHVDLTWDVNQKEGSGRYAYEYFFVDDDAIGTDHVWEPGIVPLCTGREMSYYHHSRCFANNLTQAEEIFRRVAKSKLDMVRVRIADSIPIPEPEARYLAERLRDSAAAVGRLSGIRYGWNRDTRCFYGILDSGRH